MKHLKPLLDGIVDGNITPDDFLLKECEKFDLDVNEGREFIEKWSPKASRFLAVWQSELVLTKIRLSLLETCQMSYILLKLSSPSSSSLAGLQGYKKGYI